MHLTSSRRRPALRVFIGLILAPLPTHGAARLERASREEDTGFTDPRTAAWPEKALVWRTCCLFRRSSSSRAGPTLLSWLGIPSELGLCGNRFQSGRAPPIAGSSRRPMVEKAGQRYLQTTTPSVLSTCAPTPAIHARFTLWSIDRVRVQANQKELPTSSSPAMKVLPGRLSKRRVCLTR